MRRLAVALSTSLFFASTVAQSSPAPSGNSPQSAQPDPRAVGEAALQHEDFRSAEDFFTRYVHDNPQDAQAHFLLGNAQLGSREFDRAEKTYRDVLAHDPNAWSAHSNLLLLYAESEQWPKFDQERAVVASAHESHVPGIPDRTANPIDVFTINGQRYIVREYYPPQGRFHTKYNFAWFDANGKLAGWISCESDDIDQGSFAQKHPKEAAAGQRSYSLDGYTPLVQNANGQVTQTHSTIKFYSDGEPAYEQVRADVIAVLQKRSGPMSSTTVNVSPAAGATAPK